MASTLQVSVIEGRNLSLSIGAEPYVKLELDDHMFQTSPVKGSSTPVGTMHKWLKDFKMPVLKDSVLQVLLCQDKTTLGTALIPLGPVISSGTQVQWYKLKDGTEKVMGEVCLVLRIAAGLPTAEPSPSKPVPSSVSSVPSAAIPVAAASAPPKTTPQPLKPVPTKPTASPNLKTPTKASSSKIDTKQSKQDKEKQRPVKKVKASGKDGRVLQSIPVIGLVVGALGLLWVGLGKPKFYEVQEGDTLCAVGVCFNRNFKEIYKKNPQILDPNVIYPGDKIRID
ncbi:hypothetical protein CYMTET_53635 [Cymbomonas tetramitiformis]|uniref:LysM domain-containing protein n=1 Tax=Cymbomonas tetramitiformis TaxID=36881 RepID=A0AAE0EPV6_9CHLO|nr:hypothetical protein CYMTET_53635 [Cymbomonas tetramitiformis]